MPVRRVSKDMLREALRFAGCVLKAFKANQGFLLAGGVAYYTLLSIVPLMILMFIALSHVIDTRKLVFTLQRYLELIVPGQSATIMNELSSFLGQGGVIGWVLMVTLVFFSSLAFTVLENAMSVIFHHRVAIRRRHFLVSALLPYCYIMFLGIGFLIVTLVAGALQTVGAESIDLFGRTWSLHGLSGLLLYLVGVTGELMLLTSIYLVMPVGRLTLRQAFVGGFTATVLWEITRHLLVWYFSTLSQVGEVYGSLTTSVIVLLSLELAAMVLLLGAQVIAEYERSRRGQGGESVKRMRTGRTVIARRERGNNGS